MARRLQRYSLGGCIIFKSPVSFFGVFIFIVGTSFAEANDNLPLIQFSIKPRLCVLSDGEEICEDELEIKWTADYRRSLCLYRSDREIPLQCWENKNSGEHYITIAASRNVDFQLKEVGNKQLLVTEAFEVVHDNAQYRRRRRNAWSFF
ncbi:MAG: DUF3019 domain-containing protein [Agarilytica sp.]